MARPHESPYPERLRAAVLARGNGLCVGVDPALDDLPRFFRRELDALGPGGYLDRYCAALVDAASSLAPAVKFQSAYFEAHGPEGFAALGRGLARARKAGLLTILDAKRGDIASTMKAYGVMAFDMMDADAMTVSPYMGLDVLEPLVPCLKAGRGVYVVWISSNPSGARLQEVLLPGGDTVAESLLSALSGFASDHRVPVGLVLGATKVDRLSDSTWAKASQSALLMPGVGAQGGTVTPRIKEAMQRTQTVLVPLSRGLAELPPDCSSWDGFQGAVGARLKAILSEF